MRLGTKLVFAGATVVAVGASAGAAYAFFTTGGSGSGTATVGTSVNLALELDGTVGALLPGASVPVTIKVTNPVGAPPQTVSSVTLTVSGVTQVDPNATGPACTLADFTATSPTLATPKALEPGETLLVTGSVQLLNLATNQDNCRGATVDLAFDAA